GGRGSSRAEAVGTPGPEPHAVTDVKMQTTVWRRTTLLLWHEATVPCDPSARIPAMTARNLLLAMFVVALFATSAQAQGRPRPQGHLGGRAFEANKTFGLGLEFGAPTGVVGKWFFAPDRAIDFGIGDVYRYFNRSGLHLYGDFLFHPTSLS